MSDSNNVTPLHPPAPKKPFFDPRDPKSLTFLVYGLTVLAFGISLGNQLVNWIGLGLGVAALMICASRRDEGAFWARSHFEFVLRTLVIGGAAWTLVSLLGIVVDLIPLLGKFVILTAKGVIMIWVVARVAVGYLKASDTKVIANPVTWLI